MNGGSTINSHQSILGRSRRRDREHHGHINSDRGRLSAPVPDFADDTSNNVNVVATTSISSVIPQNGACPSFSIPSSNQQPQSIRSQMMSNYYVKRRRKLQHSYLPNPRNFFSCTALLLSALSSTVEGTLFGHTSATTLTNLASWSATAQKSTVIPLDFDIPLFGNSTADHIWASAYGTLSYNQLISNEDTIGKVDDNIVLAPFFLQSISGNVAHERFNNQFDNQLIEASGNVASTTGNAFIADAGILVTWTNVKSAEDTAKQNTFQAFIVTDGTEAYAVFAYDKIEYTSSVDGDLAAVGAFVNAEDTNTCWRVINGTSLNREKLVSETNCNTDGRWVIRLDEVLWCRDQFTTACGDKPEEGEWTHDKGFFENSNRWDFFVRYECKDDFNIIPNVTTQDSFCIYDPDYYESKWSCTTPPKCQDFTIAKDFETTLLITHIDGMPIDQVYKEEGEPGYEEFMDKVIEAIKKLLEEVGLEDGVPIDYVISKDNILITRDEGGSPVLVVEYHNLLPTQTRDTATDVDIKEAHEEWLSKNPTVAGVTFLPTVDVKDKSPACLEICLGCKNPNGCTGPPPEIPPNKCCGTCENPNHEGGKAYSSVTHACCRGQFVYDPATHSCCESGQIAAQIGSVYVKVKGEFCMALDLPYSP